MEEDTAKEDETTEETADNERAGDERATSERRARSMQANKPIPLEKPTINHRRKAAVVRLQSATVMQQTKLHAACAWCTAENHYMAPIVNTSRYRYLLEVTSH